MSYNVFALLSCKSRAGLEHGSSTPVSANWDSSRIGEPLRSLASSEFLDHWSVHRILYRDVLTRDEIPIPPDPASRAPLFHVDDGSQTRPTDISTPPIGILLAPEGRGATRNTHGSLPGIRIPRFPQATRQLHRPARHQRTHQSRHWRGSWGEALTLPYKKRVDVYSSDGTGNACRAAINGELRTRSAAS